MKTIKNFASLIGMIMLLSIQLNANNIEYPVINREFTTVKVEQLKNVTILNATQLSNTKNKDSGTSRGPVPIIKKMNSKCKIYQGQVMVSLEMELSHVTVNFYTGMTIYYHIYDQSFNLVKTVNGIVGSNPQKVTTNIAGGSFYAIASAGPGLPYSPNTNRNKVQFDADLAPCLRVDDPTHGFPKPDPVDCACKKNVVKNGSFSDGTVGSSSNIPPSTVTNWSKGYRSPQYNAAGYIHMWGNKVVGEAVKQKVAFKKGHTYKICFAFRASKVKGRPEYVRFKLRASNDNNISTPVPGEVIGISQDAPFDPSRQWHQATFTWTANADYSLLYVSPENALSNNDGRYVSQGDIDNICIEEIAKPCDCKESIVKNGSFNNGTVASSSNIPPSTVQHWERAHGRSPQYAGGGDYIAMWGNKVVGEGIKQKVNFVKGFKYKVCFKFRYSGGPIKFVKFKLRASNSNLTSTSNVNASVIGISQDAHEDPTKPWLTASFTWTADANYSILYINAENNSSVNHGDYVSHGHIDDLCIEEIPNCDGLKRLAGSQINGPVNICEGDAATYTLPNFPGMTYTWAVSPSVIFTGQGTNSITIPGSATTGKTILNIKVKVSCGGQQIFKKFKTTVGRKVTDVNYNLQINQGSGGYNLQATPVLGASFDHSWTLWQSPTPINTCNFPLPSGSSRVAAAVGSNVVGFQFTGLQTGKYYMLSHYMRDCDGTVMVARKCFYVITSAKRLPGGKVPVSISESEPEILQTRDIVKEERDLLFKGKKL